MSTPTRDDSNRKRLPVKPSEEYLKKQAKRRAKTGGLQLADAQHQLAREYGAKNWAELMHVVETMLRGADQTMHVQYEMEALPKAANANDLDQVRSLLAAGAFTQHDLDLALARSLFNIKNRPPLAQLLLDHGADPDGQYGSGYGPIVLGTGEALEADALEFLLAAGADVTFPLIDTKYGPVCPLISWLNTYARGRNDAKHRGIDLLLQHGAYVPPDLDPAVFAVHRGDTKTLAEMLDKDLSLVSRRYPDMPYGNIRLAGATLLHCAVEFGELECIDLLISRGADINAKADVVDGVGGQTPIFHAINTNCDGNFAVLQHLADRYGRHVDLSVRASWRGDAGWMILNFDPSVPRTPLEYAETAIRDADPQHTRHRSKQNEELSLLRDLAAAGLQ